MSTATPGKASENLKHLQVGNVIALNDVHVKCDMCENEDLEGLELTQTNDHLGCKCCSWVDGFHCFDCLSIVEFEFDKRVLKPCESCLHRYVTDEPMRTGLVFRRSKDDCDGHWFDDNWSNATCQDCSDFFLVDTSRGIKHCCCGKWI